MGQPIEITNLEHSAVDLRRLASREKRGEVVRDIRERRTLTLTGLRFLAVLPVSLDPTRDYRNVRAHFPKPGICSRRIFPLTSSASPRVRLPSWKGP